MLLLGKAGGGGAGAEFEEFESEGRWPLEKSNEKSFINFYSNVDLIRFKK